MAMLETSHRSVVESGVSSTRVRSAIGLVLASLTLAAPTPASAAFWAWGSGSIHASITRAALPFVNSSVLDRIVSANDGTDGTGTLPDGSSYDFEHDGDYHFDQCRVSESTSRIDALHQMAADAAGSTTTQLWTVEHFGRALHAAQDFYSHSNWVDAVQPMLISRDTFAWPVGIPGEFIEGMMVLGKALPPGASIMRDPNSRVPIVTLASGAEVGGLMTAGNTASPNCPAQAGIAISHGTDTFQTSQWLWAKVARGVIGVVTAGFYFLSENDPEYGKVMNKDVPALWLHAEARALAVQQTREELCRLVRLVSMRAGQPGVEILLNAWVGAPGSAPRLQYEAACPNVMGPVTALLMAPL